MDSFDTIIRFFQDGGVFMYPIMLVLALGVAIAIERYIHLTRARSTNQKVWDELSPLLSEGSFKKAGEAVDGSEADLGRVLSSGLMRVSTARRRDDLETAMDEGLMEVIPRLEKRTHYLATFANIATLLGLLGTVIGLIRAFTAVAHAAPAEKADLLSSSISVAMNTTAFGLMVAIPLLLIYTVLQTKTTELVDNMEMVVVKFVNIVTQRRKEEADE